MAYQLETLTGGDVESRTGALGSTMDYALKAAEHLLQESGSEAARLMEGDGGDTGFGNGTIVATYTAAGGWTRLG